MNRTLLSDRSLKTISPGKIGQCQTFGSLLETTSINDIRDLRTTDKTRDLMDSHSQPIFGKHDLTFEDQPAAVII